MAFAIPEPFCWDESFATFYQLIDDEHKGLFNGIFEVAKDPADGAKLQHLLDITIKHFSDEEEMMKKANYSEFSAHQPLHVDFVAKLKGLSAPVSADSIHFAKDWLVNHIKTTDFKYKGKL